MLQNNIERQIESSGITLKVKANQNGVVCKLAS